MIGGREGGSGYTKRRKCKERRNISKKRTYTQYQDKIKQEKEDSR